MNGGSSAWPGTTKAFRTESSWHSPMMISRECYASDHPERTRLRSFGISTKISWRRSSRHPVSGSVRCLSGRQTASGPLPREPGSGQDLRVLPISGRGRRQAPFAKASWPRAPALRTAPRGPAVLCLLRAAFLLLTASPQDARIGPASACKTS